MKSSSSSHATPRRRNVRGGEDRELFPIGASFVGCRLPRISPVSLKKGFSKNVQVSLEGIGFTSPRKELTIFSERNSPIVFYEMGGSSDPKSVSDSSLFLKRDRKLVFENILKIGRRLARAVVRTKGGGRVLTWRRRGVA